MSVVVITGSSGLIGSAAANKFHNEGFDVIGIDNDMRSVFFGSDASTKWVGKAQEDTLQNFSSVKIDVSDYKAVRELFEKLGQSIVGIIHCAAQPSHDWSALDPITDFQVNANGTLNLLEATRLFCPEAAFVFMSTNKVYGDSPNFLKMVEQDSRFELDSQEKFSKFGIDESMSIDGSMHSPFGVSKASADLMVQEYSRYFGLRVAVFRGGCLTGSLHKGAELHGFLSYLVKCGVHGIPYTVFGYQGKQVRDNIHSSDLVEAIWQYFSSPVQTGVFNIGGSRYSNVSVLEAIDKIQELSGKIMHYEISKRHRRGDHIWYVSDVRKFQETYPSWELSIGIDQILSEMVDAETSR